MVNSMNDEQHNGCNDLFYFPEVGSTNTWAKEHLDRFGPVGAVYTTSQTAGRGRLGRTWVNAAGQALYYTVVLKVPLAQPETLPLFASLAVADALRERYGIDCQIKWPNDLLLRGKMPLSAASASIWPSPRAILTPWSCPTPAVWPCRGWPSIGRRTPAAWPAP